MVLVLLVVLQGGLLDGQLAVPPLVARVFQFIGGRIAGRLGQKTKGIVATYLDATDFRLQRVEEMAPRKGIRRHTKKLLNCVLYGNWWNQLLARRVPLKNVVLPFDDAFQVAEAINGTQFEKFMCEVLKDSNTVGTTAVYAEPGVGKSIAALLAVLQTNTSETCMTVILRGEFSSNLQKFFRLQDALDAADVARSFFSRLQKQGIRLQIVLDNTFDSGLQPNGDRLMELTRAAHELGHHLIVITQSRERAQEVSDLNGARTRLALQQQQDERVYRWSSEQARRFLKTLQPKESEQVIDKVLNDTQVPDEFRLWKPSDIREYLTSGCKPKAPQPARPGASETQTKAVWVRQLRQDGAGGFELAGNAFPIDPAPTNIAYLKEAIKKKKPNRVRCDPDEIDIYSREDGSWNKQDEEAALERGASKSDCYGFLLP